MKLNRKFIFSSGVLVIAFLGYFLSAYKYSDLKGLRRLVVAFQIAIFLARHHLLMPKTVGFCRELRDLHHHHHYLD
jgi:hypothetical protein